MSAILNNLLALFNDFATQNGLNSEWKQFQETNKEKFVLKNLRVKSEKEIKETRPKTAYLLFCDNYRKEHKDTKVTVAVCGTAWKSLDEKTKKVFQEQAAALRPEKEKKEKKPRSPSAYILFCNHYRPALKIDKPNLKSKEIITELAEIWKSIPDNDVTKKKWQSRAAAAKVAFLQEHPELIKEALPLKTGNNALKPYLDFCAIHRPILKAQGLPTDEVKKQLGELWKKEKAQHNAASKSLER